MSGKFHGLGDIEIINGFDEAHTAYLKQVVRVFTASGEPLDDGQHQPQVSLDELTAGLLVALFRPAQQFHGFIVFQDLQLRRVHSRDLDFSLHRKPPPASCKLL